MKEIPIMIDDLKVEKKREVLLGMGFKNPKEAGLDKDPLAIVKVPDEWQLRITKGTEILQTWTVGEEETDDGTCDFYLEDGFPDLTEKLEDAFEIIVGDEEEEEEKKDDIEE